MWQDPFKQNIVVFEKVKFLKVDFKVGFIENIGIKIASTVIKGDNCWKVITGVVIIASGLLMYLTPAGPFAGAALTSAGINGII